MARWQRRRYQDFFLIILVLLSPINEALSASRESSPCEPDWRSDCERSWERRFKSPDGKWLAVVHDDVCSGGLGSDGLTVVDLVVADRPQQVVTVLIPFGQWTQGEVVRLTWTSARNLEIFVPNRTDFSLSMVRYSDIDIAVKFDHDNPEDREKWRNWVKEHSGWLKNGSKGVEPQLP
jgi:hypothetical protein